MVHPFVVTAVLLVLTAALTSVRPARSGTWLVVLRFGRVNRIATSGVVVRIPGIDRCLVVPRVPERLPFTVSARSAEGVRTHVLGEITVRVTDPGAADLPDPIGAAAIAVEDYLRRLIAHTEVVGLVGLCPAPQQLPGVDIEAVLIDHLEIELTEWSAARLAGQVK